MSEQDIPIGIGSSHSRRAVQEEVSYGRGLVDTFQDLVSEMVDHRAPNQPHITLTNHEEVDPETDAELAERARRALAQSALETARCRVLDEQISDVHRRLHYEIEDEPEDESDVRGVLGITDTGQSFDFVDPGPGAILNLPDPMEGHILDGPLNRPDSFGRWAQLHSQLREELKYPEDDIVTKVSINNVEVKVAQTDITIENSLTPEEGMVTVEIEVKMTRQEYDRIMELRDADQKALNEPAGRKILA